MPKAKTMSGSDESTSRLLLDSNIWIKEVGLMSKRASTLRLYMRERGVRLVVPEVVRVESTRHFVDRMRTKATAGQKAHEELVRMLGSLAEWQIPSDDEIIAHAERLAKGVDLPVDHIDLEPETALRGARRCMGKRPPAHRSDKAFMDSIIWEEVVNVLRSHALCFVTNDKGFFDPKGTGPMLHPYLAAEADSAMHPLAVQTDLDELLEDFRAEFKIDAEVLSEFVRKWSETIRQAAEEMGFEANGSPQVNYKAFATEKAHEVEVRFTSVQPFEDATEQRRSTDGLHIQARAVYRVTTGELVEVSMDRAGLLYLDGDARQKAVPGSAVYARAGLAAIGARQIASDRRDEINPA